MLRLRQGLLRVFISYSFADREIMKMMHRSLERRGIGAYSAEHDPQYGAFLGEKIRRAINECNVLVAIITKDNPSPSVNQEIGYALNRNMPVLALVEKGSNTGFMLKEREYLEFERKKVQLACEKAADHIANRMGGTSEFEQLVSAVEGDTLFDERKEIEEYEVYAFDADDGEIITGEINSDIPINIFIVDNRNLRKYEDGYDFMVEEEVERVLRYSLKFVVPKSTTWNVVVENDNSEPANVDVKLRYR